MMLYLFAMKTLYKDILLDHYKNPHNKGIIQEADFTSKDSIPSCGDSISMQGIIEHDKVKKVMFEGTGCVISQATASMLTDVVIGKTINEVLSLAGDDVQKMIGMQLGPIRLKCALLPLYVLQQGLKKYRDSLK